MSVISYDMDSNITIEIDENPDDLHREGPHCHVKKRNRGRVAQVFLNPSARFSRTPNSDDLSYSEQNEVLKYCDRMRSTLLSDCERILNRR